MKFDTPRYDALLKIFEEMAFDVDSKEGKMFAALLDGFRSLEGVVTEQAYRMDEIDEDLAEVESEFFGELARDLEDGELFEMVCPGCSSRVYIDSDMLSQDKIVCPSCNAEFDFEVDMDGGDDSEGGGHVCGGCGGCGGGC